MVSLFLCQKTFHGRYLTLPILVLDVLAGDRQLANEIEFDLRRYEEERKQAAMEAVHPSTPNRNAPQHRVNLEMAKTPLGRAMSVSIPCSHMPICIQ